MTDAADRADETVDDAADRADETVGTVDEAMRGKPAEGGKAAREGTPPQQEEAARQGKAAKRRRRLVDALPAVLAPLAASAIALGGLTTWVGTGHAGSPARIDVVPGRVYLPYGDGRETAAYFDIANSGGSGDRLTGATSPSALGEITLTRHRVTEAGGAYRDSVASTAVPAGGELSMSPHGVSLTLLPKDGLQPGDIVPFTLRFEHRGPVSTVAVVVRPVSSSL
ncbi:copper chaperone PCu(A)C [Streptomyces pacificus]|uniref:Copper chaperone PCu(A)C n=1 Tax=Streptomyces pacificus TaxID=2705029 RepID=A0A6A0AX30_9ACTN|nr:copper chaperone PCu(A)C [Streptomyces pacificus]GFH37489.1 copper chaperone PCu(A)C [Streptomyces pacificus]